MENRLLKYFLVVAQEENITRAAEILHVSQPALSKQIMQLEDELGAKLFLRGKRSLTLTEEGRFLRSRAQEIVDLTEKTERDFRDGIVSYNGTVSIGMGETAASRWLSAQTEKFSESYPDVRFDFYSATADSVREKIEKGLLDMGLLIEPTGDLSKYDFIRLPVMDRWGVLVSVKNPLAGKDAVTRDDLMREKLFIPFRIFPCLSEMFGISAETANIRGTHNLLYNVASVVQNNSAVAITIGGAAEIYDPCKLVWRPFSPAIGFHSVLIWKKYKASSPSAAKFLEFIKHSI
jgi:hypothetical protein